MSVTAAVTSGRAAAVRLMVDTCTITRVTSRTFNETTGAYLDTLATIYAGKCRIKFPRFADRIVDAGERPAAIREYIVSVPMAAAALEPDDIVTVTASSLDPQQVGVTMRVLGATHGSQITARRARCQEVTT